MAHRKKLTKKRAARGMGTVFWSDSLELWVGRLPIGRTPAGNTRYRVVQRATKPECVAALKELRPLPAAVTLREWCDRWRKELDVQPSSRDDYLHTLDRFILPTLGHLKLATLTAPQVEAAFRIWAGSLNPNTLRKNARHLAVCLEAARRAGLIATNPAKDARKPKSRRVVVEVFTADELRAIIELPGSGIFALLASVGLRLGEAIALDISDFDTTAGTVAITKTHCRAHGTRRPKSENGIRTVRVPAPALPAIREAAGRRKAGPLFLSERGTRRQHSPVRAQWATVLEELGFAYRRPHVLRHSVASVMLANGVPIPDVARYLGDSVAVVVRTYLQPTGVDAAAALEGALQGRQKVGEKPPRARIAHES